MTATNFEIIAGTYEEYLLGYIFSSEEKTLTQSFASHDHSSCIRCLATSGNYLASGASDDRIIIYDMKTRKDHCMLTHHDSTVTALAFTNNHSHVISASQDGALAIVRVGNWQLEKLWQKPHKEGTVLDIAVHSSGKLALTLGSDSTIRTWNLVKGREAYIINLKTKCKDPKSLERIVFAPDDTRFAIFGGKYMEIWSIELGGALKVIELNQKITCLVWIDNETVFVGFEDGNLGVIDVESESKIIKLGHNGRVRAVQHFEGYLVTGSSTGEVKVWTRKLKELCEVATGCRITCLIIVKWMGKLKKEDPEQEPVPEASIRQPVKRSVVVEVDGSSSEEESEKKKKPENTFQTSEQKLSKNKKKKSSIKENPIKKKKLKKKQVNREESKLKIKKKKNNKIDA